MEIPKLSYKTITYGRVHLLQEALYSFLNQNFDGESEMIIVNDYPLQKLIFEHPKVKIYNLDTTFSTIGEKENFAIERCSGELIITGDDDDIALLNHLSNITQWWKENDNILFWERAVYYNEPEITAITNVGNSGFVFSKKAWEAVGRSPIANAGGDMIFANKLRNLDESKIRHASPSDAEISWFYRWALPMNYHQSGMGTDTPDRENVIIRNAKYVEHQRKAGRIPTGEIELVPQWRHDYDKMLKNYINGRK